MAAAFAPPTTFRSATKLNAIDPSAIHDLSQHHAVAADSINHFFSSLMISDLDTAVDAAATIPMDAAPGAATDAAAAAANDNGWFGFLTGPIESLLKLIHTVLTSVGLSEDAWGVSIIVMTVLIKALTFPLTKSQLESTNKMQALQPTVKALQAKYQSNPEVMNQKIAEIYQQNDVNPLAGCIPSLAQIPIFIGLYRAVLTLAKENALDEPFLFLPNLEGPTYGADPAHGSDWLFKNWVDGVPSLGWENTIAFLSIPIFLTISQVISMNIMQPKTDDPQQQQANVILKVLPFMVGWFALNVPAALGIYWVVNNIVTTATTMYIRSTMPAPDVAAAGGGAAAASAPVMEAKTTDFNPTPMNDRAVGFGGAADDEDVMTTITPIDAEIVSEDGPDIPPAPKAKRSGGKKKKKRRN
jgi:YidC/Oxa1 family membrane protein insertase